MDDLILVAAKSFLIAGAVLLILKLMSRRSAADRSFIAHLGLAALVILPLATLIPQIEVPAPWIEAETSFTGEFAGEPAAPAAVSKEAEVVASTSRFPVAEPSWIASVDWAFWGYAAPAGLLLLFTLIALLRLVLLKSKANVMVEPNWLTALAQAQRRMGFKHGTALLTSDELRSPISWGLMRPVILLNSEAADAHDEAEAIIAHELAHVARLDWVKLLLSRVTVALFWFNPLVWLLAREAHQLREEAADDAVLGSDIEDTEYARLLVGIARHECRGLLIGAHGVAPGRTSLARRVQRVLDAASARAPGGWRWTAAAGFFAAGMAVPLATLQFVPMTPAAANAGTVGGKVAARPAEPVAQVAAPVAPATVLGETAVAPAAMQQPGAGTVSTEDGRTVITSARGGTITSSKDGRTVLRSPHGGTITIHAPDAHGRRRTVLTSPGGGVVTYADASAVPGLASATAVAGTATARARAGDHDDDAIDRAIELKAVGATPEYVRSIRTAAPHLRLGHDEVVEFAALRISPTYLRDLASSGYPHLDADDVVEAKALGINGSYIRAMTAALGRLTMDQLVELKAVGVTPADIQRFRRAGGKLPTVNRLVELKALGITPEDLKAADSP